MSIFGRREPDRDDELWRQRVERLARYNSERDRGIVHTPEWQELMEREQDEFNRRQHTDAYYPVLR